MNCSLHPEKTFPFIIAEGGKIVVQCPEKFPFTSRCKIDGQPCQPEDVVACRTQLEVEIRARLQGIKLYC
jgi:hypothetical protein